jgi:hypothetical protein
MEDPKLVNQKFERRKRCATSENANDLSILTNLILSSLGGKKAARKKEEERDP